jgi:HAD superfamily hydrolase (TIGR01509 family)
MKTCSSLLLAFVIGVDGFMTSKVGPAFVRQQQDSRRFASDYEYALLFDCDGVILETEELHRVAYNAAFEAAELTIDGTPVEWSVEYYDVLQNTVGGGKPKMFFHFRNTTGQFPMVGDKPAPGTPEEKQELVDNLQAHKTQIYRDYIEEKAVPRPGVIELMDEALADSSIAVGVCSASTKEAVTKVLAVTLGEERRSKLDVCILGDDVSEKKPSPMIYNEARERLGLDKDRCVVIEDSMVGLRAAKAAVSAVTWIFLSGIIILWWGSHIFSSLCAMTSYLTGHEVHHHLHSEHRSGGLLRRRRRR